MTANPAGRHAAEAVKEARKSFSSAADSVSDTVSDYASGTMDKATSLVEPARDTAVREMQRSTLTMNYTTALRNIRTSHSVLLWPSASFSACF